MGLATFYGGLGQILAGMWEFKNGNTFAATLFTSYGGFFLSMAALRMSCFSFLAGYVGHEKDLHDGLGIYFLAWAMFSLWMTISSHRTTFVLFIFLFFVFIQFLMLSIAEFTSTTFESVSMHTQEAGGCFGVMAAFFAWYAAYAALLSKKQSLFGLPAGDLNAVYKTWGLVQDEEKSN